MKLKSTSVSTGQLQHCMYGVLLMSITYTGFFTIYLLDLKPVPFLAKSVFVGC